MPDLWPNSSMGLVLDNNSDGSTVEYLNGAGSDKLRQVSAATGSLYFLQDHLSSTAALTNASGGVVERQQYQAFGAGTGSALTRFGYLSSELDNLTGLLFNGGRWYDPQQGRFIMQDPLGFRGGGANFYSLGNNDPVGLGWSSLYFPASLFGRRSSECGVPQNSAACDKKLAGIFGGPGAVVGSVRDPLTVGSNPNALAYARRYGLPTDRIGERSIGHGPVPYDNPDPRSSDRGGIIHIYGNDNGTATGTGLYTPAGGSVGRMRTRHAGTPYAYTQINVTYNRGPYAGLTIAFVHVSAGRGGPNAMGSVRIGNIGGLGSIDSPNYIHTHAVFYMNGVRVDPRTIFCKEFGF